MNKLIFDGLINRHVVEQHLFPNHKLEFVFDVGVGAGKGGGLRTKKNKSMNIHNMEM